jgi:hypothetical protein
MISFIKKFIKWVLILFSIGIVVLLLLNIFEITQSWSFFLVIFNSILIGIYG